MMSKIFISLGFYADNIINAGGGVRLICIKAFGVILASVLLSCIISAVMREKGIKHNQAFNMYLSWIVMLALFIRFDLSLAFLQGTALYFVLLYASCSDITSHTADDCLWVMILLLGLCSIQSVGVASMLCGAAVVFVPQILSALICEKTVGGADIKFSSALAFLLGVCRGFVAFVIGLIIAVVVMSIIQKIKKEKQPFALLPFLSATAMIVFFI